MNWLWDGEVSTIEVGGTGHIVYIMMLIITFGIIYRQRHRFGGRLLCIYIAFTILGVIHQLMVTSWYVFEIGYELSNALPLHICRVVIWLIILQALVRRMWLTEVIFFFGLYAYGSFALPIAIHPPFHFAGWTFVLMHSMIIIYPFVIHWATGWIPTFKGALLSFGLFLVYFVLVLIVNGWVDANYFYLNNRPFLHDMADIRYTILNAAGTFCIFMLGLLLARVLLKFEKREH